MPDLRQQPSQPTFIVQTPIPSETFANRRSVIGTLGAAVAGLYASTGTAGAMWKWGGMGDLPVVKVKTIPSDARLGNGGVPSKTFSTLPEQWVSLQGRSLKNYTNYLNSLRLRNIHTQDVIAAHAKQHGSVWNMLPPREWWARMGYTLRVVDRISSELRIPVDEIVSAYRTPTYNASCRGARRQSWHQANVAIDVRFETSGRSITSAIRSLRDRGLFKGGVGGYSRFTHIDTRGVNANW
jgi:hypothetical protein